MSGRRIANSLHVQEQTIQIWCAIWQLNIVQTLICGYVRKCWQVKIVITHANLSFFVREIRIAIHKNKKPNKQSNKQKWWAKQKEDWLMTKSQCRPFAKLLMLKDFTPLNRPTRWVAGIIAMEMLHVWQIPGVLLLNYSRCAFGMDSGYFVYQVVCVYDTRHRLNHTTLDTFLKNRLGEQCGTRGS